MAGTGASLASQTSGEGRGLGTWRTDSQHFPGVIPTSCTLNKKTTSTQTEATGEATLGIPCECFTFPALQTFPSNNLQVFLFSDPKVGSCQSEGGRLGEHGLVLAYIFIPKPCFKFQSGFQSCNNTRGKEEQKKSERAGREKECLTGPGLLKSCQLSGLLI